MKIGKRSVLCMLLLLVLAGTALITFDPQVKAETFVARWGKQIEEGIASGNGIPAGAGDHMGNDCMIEFTLSARGFGSQTSYYGCYYSYEDVPFAYGFAEVELIPAGNDRWTWQEEGDNHGLTEKIRAHWYYFEAYF